MSSNKISFLQEKLLILETEKSLSAGKEVVKAVVGLIIPNVHNSDFKLFREGDGKITANAGWFQFDDEIADRRATYVLEVPSESNIDIKLFGINKLSMRTIAWAVGLTPNFEDEPFNGRYNVGIDFVIPDTKDRVIVVLSKNYKVRTVELKGQLTATFHEIFNSWASISDTSRKAELHSILWNSFDLHPINKKFYEGISYRFIHLRQHLESASILDNHHAAQFANRLIGRVIFTWFLDRKKFLNESSRYFDSTDFDDDTSYYKTRLEPLFFEVLNMPVSERSTDDLLTPYLNGGLFEPKPDDLYKTDALTFPKNYFDDLFEFLRGYNFTTDESTSDFQQVAIDPEMLGRIFENLLAEVSEETGAQARKAKGAFYTPREVVDYMCRQSLKEFLMAKIQKDENLDRRLYQLIDAPEREFHDQDHNWRRDLKPYKDELLSALDELRVIDPACGSGAFPIGMLQLLVKVYSRLEPRFDTEKAKLSIVDKNIYGVDIEPMAVEISRLRTWLALVVDQSDDKMQVKPLPNLDFKFVCANSLVNLENPDTFAFFDDNHLELKLQEIREQYFRTQSFTKKKDLRGKYKSLVEQEMTLFGENIRSSQLRSFQPFEGDSVALFFDAKHMFGIDRFDIVIGNPPYIGEKGNKDIFRAVKNSSLGKRFAQGKMDYFYYFFHLAIDLCAEGGVICYITTNYYPKAPSAKLLRKDFKEKTNVLKLINFQELKIFKSAVGQHNLITLLNKTEPDADHMVETCVTYRRGDADSSVLNGILSWTDEETSYFSIKQSELYKGERLDIVVKAGTGLDQILDRLEDSSIQLSELVTITNGLHTGADNAFVFETVPEILMQDKNVVSNFIKPIHKNSDIFKYGIRETNKKVLYIPNGLSLKDFPSIETYLTPFKDKLSSRAQIVRSKQPWHQLLWPRDPKLFAPSPKIVAPYSSRDNCFFYTEDQFYGSGDTYVIVSRSDADLKLICALLNSTVGLVWFKNRGKLKGEMIFLQGDSLGVFPIPKHVASDDVAQIESLVTAIQGLIAKENEFTEIYHSDAYLELYRKIDERVFEIYGLSAEDKKVLEEEALIYKAE